MLVYVHGDRFAERTDRRDLIDFARARVARIVPLHLFALAVVAAILLARG